MPDNRALTWLRTIFAIALVALFAMAIVAIGGRTWQVGRFPLILAYVGLALATLDLAMRAWGVRRNQQGHTGTQVSEIVETADLFSDASIETPSGLLRAVAHFAGLIAFVASIYLISYAAATFIYIVLFYRLIGRARWLTSLIAALAGSSLLWALTQVLNLRWPAGILF